MKHLMQAWHPYFNSYVKKRLPPICSLGCHSFRFPSFCFIFRGSVGYIYKKIQRTVVVQTYHFPLITLEATHLLMTIFNGQCNLIIFFLCLRNALYCFAKLSLTSVLSELYVHDNRLACLSQSIIFHGNFMKLTIDILNKHTRRKANFLY